MSDFAKAIQLYNLSTNTVLAEFPFQTAVTFLEGDELEMPDYGAFRIVRRRWSLSGDQLVLVLVIAPLA